MEDYQLTNQIIWDQRVHNRNPHTRSVSKKDLENPIIHIDPLGWLNGNVTDQKVLCLASGGGLQSILFAKAGAQVTVLDISQAMLEKDKEMARKLGLKVECLHQSMEDLTNLAPSSFDLVVQPVSTCYVPDIVKVYQQVARILKTDGLYICQHKQPGSLQASPLPGNNGYYYEEKYYRTGPLKQTEGSFEHREPGALEFLHRWELIVGGLCREGFVIEDLMEPRHANSEAQPGTFGHRSCYIPPYVLMKARRTAKTATLMHDNEGLIIK